LNVMLALIEKFDPDQPRHPPGSPEGGQWAPAGEGGGGTGELTASDKQAIESYTETDYGAMNRLLRGTSARHDIPGQEPETMKKIEALKTALDKLPGYEGTTDRFIVSARLRGGTDYADLYQPGTVIEEKAFLSTAKTGALAAGAWNTEGYDRIAIVGRSGRDISNYSAFKDESEVLFRPGTRFRVDRIASEKVPPWFEGPERPEVTRRVVHLTEV